MDTDKAPSQSVNTGNIATSVPSHPQTPARVPQGAPVSPASTPLRLDLASLASKQELTTWAEFRDGFQLEIRYIGRTELQKLSKASTTNKYNNKTHQREVELDTDKFLPKFVAMVVKGWKGLTPNKLTNFVTVDISGIPEEDRDREIAYDQTQLIYLTKNCYDLDTFLNQVCTDLTWFRDQDEEEAAKN